MLHKTFYGFKVFRVWDIKCSICPSLGSNAYYCLPKQKVKFKCSQPEFILNHDRKGVNLLRWGIMHRINCGSYLSMKKSQKLLGPWEELAPPPVGAPDRSMVQSNISHVIWLSFLENYHKALRRRQVHGQVFRLPSIDVRLITQTRIFISCPNFWQHLLLGLFIM